MSNLKDELKIQDIFDMEIWQKIQDSFARATGFAAIIVDKEGKPVLDYSNFCDYCLKVRDTELCETCFLSDATGGNLAAQKKEPVIYRCHAGLIDFAVPLIVQGQYMGAILAGQARLDSDSINEYGQEIVPMFEKDNFEILQNSNDLLFAYNKIAEVDYERIRAAADLLYTLANHLAEMKLVNQMQTQLHEKEIKLSEERKIRSEVEAALKEADLKALQSQVNPHFLFNVLNTIGRLASIEDAKKTEEIVYQFADLMRYSLKRNNVNAVTINDELNYVHNYLSIQKIRLGDRLWYDIHTDPDVGQSLCPSMIIQPFVENIINHVIEPRIIGGKIEIRVLNCDNTVRIEINDNGEGISEDKVQKILNGTYSADGKSTGLGIVNVNKRLKYYYGPEYDLKIQQRDQGGTQVIIQIPRHDIEL